MKIGKLIVMVVAVVVLTALGYGLASWFLGKPAQTTEGATQLEQTLAQLANDTVTTDSEYAVGDRLTGNADNGSKKATVFDPAFPELQWDNLMPADWDPMAAFRGLNIAELQDNDPKAQEALEKMRKAWNDAPVNTAYTGKKVRIPGFAIPIEQSEKGVDELLLVPYFGACIHTPPPPANQIIHVKLSEPQPAVGAMQAYWVWGELTASKFSSELGDAAYLLSATGIQPYED
ncbi:DUF3299 domain-containing protein [Limnobacter sp.]|jgi:uncharacterized protein|uniref:DUF3299 domain-containing protein n=1 Tax=Limnobacter sp. TaxID=2003368 RepID=UPI00273255A6|nr:DUF3299 domain-containing protein [Limnobacter sp.]MDP3272274.1 DUF3299 domain-containing protein [Limnobacter sp.]